jgi:hypothetical protein
MRHRARFALILLCAIVFASDARGEELLGPRQILDHVDDLFRGTASHGTMTMTITTAHWTRALSLEFWSRGTDKFLVRILAPIKEEGTGTLRVGNDLWNYLPKVKRVIKLPSSMLSAAWMGSHFTNNDLVKQSRMTDDYTFEQSFAGVRDGEEVVEITCLPKPDAAVVWGKVIVRVRRRDYLPLAIHYYDEKLQPVRTMTFGDFKTLGGRLLPSTMAVVPADKPRSSSTSASKTTPSRCAISSAEVARATGSLAPRARLRAGARGAPQCACRVRVARRHERPDRARRQYPHGSRPDRRKCSR